MCWNDCVCSVRRESTEVSVSMAMDTSDATAFMAEVDSSQFGTFVDGQVLPPGGSEAARAPRVKDKDKKQKVPAGPKQAHMHTKLNDSMIWALLNMKCQYDIIQFVNHAVICQIA